MLENVAHVLEKLPAVQSHQVEHLPYARRLEGPLKVHWSKSKRRVERTQLVDVAENHANVPRREGAAWTAVDECITHERAYHAGTSLQRDRCEAGGKARAKVLGGKVHGIARREDGSQRDVRQFRRRH